jgi:hypothetical protein
LVDEHPLQEEPDAEDDTVSPLLPLLTKPQADMSLITFLLLHESQTGFSFPKTRASKFLLQLLQWYS